MAALSVFKKPEDKTRAEIARLEAAREKLYHSREQAVVELRLLEAQRPEMELERLLAAVAQAERSERSDVPEYAEASIAASDELRERIQEARSAIAAADLAEVALIPRLERAGAELRELEAQAIDRQAEKLSKELSEHTRKVNAAMQALSELEGGATYVNTASHTRQVVRLASLSGGKAIPPDFGPVATPRSELLAAEIMGLRGQAAAIRRRQVRSHGQAGGNTVDELLAQLREPGVVAPAEGDVRAWFETAGKTAVERWQKSIDAQMAGAVETRVSFVLVWTSGRIDTAASRAVVSPVQKVRTGPLRERKDAEGPIYTT